MFDKYFLSGDDIPIKSRALVEDDDFDFKMANFDLPEIELDGIKATGNVKLTSGIKASDNSMWGKRIELNIDRCDDYQQLIQFEILVDL